MLKIAICDDDASERLRLKEWLSSYLTVHHLLCDFTEYACGEALSSDYNDRPAKYDLVFLDIYMDGINGMETAAIIRQHDPIVPIIFLTTSPDYAIEGYSVAAAGYLLKPATDEQLSTLMGRLFHALRQISETSLLVGGQTRLRRVNFSDVCWLESQNRNVAVHLTDGTVHMINERLNDLKPRLPASCFLKCNRGIIVNMEHVAAVGEDFVMSDGSRVPIKVRERKNIRDQYFSYMMDTKARRKVDSI